VHMRVLATSDGAGADAAAPVAAGAPAPLLPRHASTRRPTHTVCREEREQVSFCAPKGRPARCTLALSFYWSCYSQDVPCKIRMRDGLRALLEKVL
jgi:hypothetical protein